MEKIKTKTSLFGAALTLAAVLLALTPAHAQYMSFFGDSTWEYHAVVVTQPPENYLNFPPEIPSPLGAYSHTCSYKFNKNIHSYSNPNAYLSLGYDTDPLIWGGGEIIYEDTIFGRLYSGRVLICDMSLSEGDTFCLENYITDNRLMLVDSVRYMAGRKTIYLSLIDHLDDYFFGTLYASQHAEFPLSIRFIEGIGPSYGISPWGSEEVPPYGAHLNEGYDFLSYLLCLHKDDSLVYLADERLGCVQTCVGLDNQPYFSMSLYPNPATQYMVLDMSTGEEMEGSVEVTDMLGRQFLQQKAEGTRVQILVADLPTGMYFLTYSDGKRKVTKKFMKE